jgi:hypothetical protein
MARTLLAAFVALSCAACAAPPPPAPVARGVAGGTGYALLYDLLGQEKDVDKLLIIKTEHDDFQAIIDAIAERTGRAYEELGALGEADPALNLSDPGLPAGEVAARDAIKAAKQKSLLTENGEELELQLSLAQSEALGYIGGLTEALSRAESDPARLEFTRALWRDARRLHEDLLALLRARRR